jgi:hypothetical protein
MRKGSLRHRWIALPALAAIAAAAALLPAAGSARSATAPSNTSEPEILGTAVEGNTLTASNGTWSGTKPMTFSYHWLRCPSNGGKADGSNCGVIPDATKSAYQLQSNDVGYRIRVRVTATNGDGSASAASNPTGTVKAAGKKPASTNLPTISGTPDVGQTLTANAGTWSGTQPITFHYQWARCNKIGGDCSNIVGATDKTYTLKSVDLGNTLRVRVAASNSAGSTNATSAPTAVVGPAPTPASKSSNGCPRTGAAVSVSQVSLPARLLIDGIRVSPSVVTRSTREIVARFHVSACGGGSVQGALVYGATVPFNQFSVPAEQTTGANGWVTLTMRRLSGFPAARRQQLLVMFVRARKPGQNVLSGISVRRLVSFHVNLSR